MPKSKLGRTRLNLQIPPKLLNAFKKAVKDHNTNVTAEVRAFMQKRLAQWGR